MVTLRYEPIRAAFGLFVLPAIGSRKGSPGDLGHLGFATEGCNDFACWVHTSIISDFPKYFNSFFRIFAIAPFLFFRNGAE